ncbi:uncharacterized protein LOC108326939 isoform X2 [Vigna angularis]|uniref:uncharacterized protein LOC108326939 isoform X2 n=1 Tax=Phaseolus angularis TaxID=3914 RepID=UPI0022B33367|nr:uncharacterized protein LOC108326939 isoform X2 [Vigna angularis]
MPFKVIHYDFSLVGSLLYFHAIALSYSTTLKSVLVHATVNAAGNELLHPVGIEHAFPQCVRTRAVVKKKGRNNVTVDELVHVITPKGRASVPDTIKAELLQRIRTFLVSAAL